MDHARHTENVRTLTEEAASPKLSTRGQEAERELAGIHPDLPDVLRGIAIRMPIIIQQNPERIAVQCSEAAAREINATGKKRLTQFDVARAGQNGAKAVMVQEAAAYLVHVREPKQDIDDFLSLDKAYRRSPADPGLLAMQALNKSGTDMNEFARGMETRDLRAIATGQFHRVSDAHRDKVTNLLEVPGNELYTIAHGRPTQERDFSPVVNHPKAQHRHMAAPRRHATFGKRLAAHQQQQAAGAGR